MIKWSQHLLGARRSKVRVPDLRVTFLMHTKSLSRLATTPGFKIMIVGPPRGALGRKVHSYRVAHDVCIIAGN